MSHSAVALPFSLLRANDRRAHVVLPEQHAATGCALTSDPAGAQPSIHGADRDAAQQSHFSLREELLVVGVFRRHGFRLIGGLRARGPQSPALRSKSKSDATWFAG